MGMIEFSENQKRAIASGLTAVSLALTVGLTACVAWAILKLVSFASPAIAPVLLGFFLALFFKPYYNWWKKLLRNPTLALLAMLSTVFIPLGFVFWYAGSVLADQLTNLVNQGPELVREVSEWFGETFPKAKSLLAQFGNPQDQLGTIYVKYGSTALKAGATALKCVAGVISALITIIFFVVFLTTRNRKGSEIVSGMSFLKEDTRTFVGEQVDAFFDILVSFFQRQTVICLIEGVMYGTGFWLVGLPYGFLIGFALGVINLIPFFGSILCLPIALPLAYFPHGGSLTRLLLVLAVWLCGQFLDGYVITPRIQGDKTGLGYAGVIFSFVFWATVLGPLLGMLLAIPLSAFCVVLWRALKAKYVKPVV